MGQVLEDGDKFVMHRYLVSSVTYPTAVTPGRTRG